MKRKATEIFSMSFLDIMSCGFGAIVLILLISQFQTSNEINDILPNQNIAELEKILEELKEEKNSLINDFNSLVSQEENLNSTLNDTVILSDNLVDIASASSKENKILSTDINKKNMDAKDVKVEVANAGGLNVESDYIVFIIDNSGSMQDWGPWNKVISEISKIIDAFPNLKGFQVLNDQGRKMMKSSDKWIEDTESTFAIRLIAFAIIEGIFFSGAFCSIYWLKEKGLMHGLTFTNELISRDESLHTEFAILLYSHITNRVSEENVHLLIKEAVDIAASI